VIATDRRRIAGTSDRDGERPVNQAARNSDTVRMESPDEQRRHKTPAATPGARTDAAEPSVACAAPAGSVGQAAAGTPVLRAWLRGRVTAAAANAPQATIFPLTPVGLERQQLAIIAVLKQWRVEHDVTAYNGNVALTIYGRSGTVAAAAALARGETPGDQA
jgi:hypothetical protein